MMFTSMCLQVLTFVLLELLPCSRKKRSSYGVVIYVDAEKRYLPGRCSCHLLENLISMPLEFTQDLLLLIGDPNKTYHINTHETH